MQFRRQRAWLNTFIDLMCVFPSRLYRTNPDVEYVEYRGFGSIYGNFFSGQNFGMLMQAGKRPRELVKALSWLCLRGSAAGVTSDVFRALLRLY